jgi:hypothetical protein
VAPKEFNSSSIKPLVRSSPSDVVDSSLEDEVDFSFDEVESSFLAQPKNKMDINRK